MITFDSEPRYQPFGYVGYLRWYRIRHYQSGDLPRDPVVVNRRSCRILPYQLHRQRYRVRVAHAARPQRIQKICVLAGHGDDILQACRIKIRHDSREKVVLCLRNVGSANEACEGRDVKHHSVQGVNQALVFRSSVMLARPASILRF